MSEPATPPTAATPSQLVPLLREHRAQALQIAAEPELAGPPLSQDDIDQLRQQAHRAVDNAKRDVDVFSAIVRTWRAIDSDDSLSRRGRHQALTVLLKDVDDFLSTQPLRALRLEAGESLVLGRRFWRSGRHHSPAPPPDTTQPWHHMRLVPCVEPEWTMHKDAHRILAQAAAPADVMEEPELRVGLFALSGRAHTRWRYTGPDPLHGGRFGFRSADVRVNHAEAPDADDAGALDPQYARELVDCFAYARRERVHVLCLPELAVCPEGRRIVRQELERDPGSLGLVLPGSWHTADPSGHAWRNEAPIWLRIGSRIYEAAHPYHKWQRFHLRAKVAAPPASPVPPLPLLYPPELKPPTLQGGEFFEDSTELGGLKRVIVTALGAFGVTICRDALFGSGALMDQYRQLADHIVILSMNSNEAWFATEGTKGLHHDVATYYVNARQVVPAGAGPTVEVASVHVPPRYRRTARCWIAGPPAEIEGAIDGGDHTAAAELRSAMASAPPLAGRQRAEFLIAPDHGLIVAVVSLNEQVGRRSGL